MYISTHTDKNINSATRNNLVDTGFSRRVSCAARREASILSFNFNDGLLDPEPQRSHPLDQDIAEPRIISSVSFKNCDSSLSSLLRRREK